MYSRYEKDSKRPIRLPEHYGGSTFSQVPTESIVVPHQQPTKPLQRSGVGEKASPIADRMLRAETIGEEAVDIPTSSDVPIFSDAVDEVAEEKEEALPEVSTDKKQISSPLNFASLRRLFGGKDGDGGDDQDRLLLLGLILLLSRAEGDSDILLWLSLLLLCG